MRKNKLGAIFLISVLSLTGISVSYAGFTDEITVTGTITTGTVDLEVVKISGTWVYKVPEHGIVINHGWAGAEGEDLDPPDDGILVAYSSGYMTADDEVMLEWENLFPLEDNGDFITDILFHYVGTVPARLIGLDPLNDYGLQIDYSEDIMKGEDPWVNELIEKGYVWAEAYVTEALEGDMTPDDLFETRGETVYFGHQLHYCDYFKVDIHFDIEQDNKFQGRAASGSVTLSVIQWNELEVED